MDDYESDFIKEDTHHNIINNINNDCDKINSGKQNVENKLLAACEKGDLSLVQQLIDSGYCDDENKALSIAISKSNTKLIGILLALKSYQDPEFKINKKNIQFSGNQSNMIKNLTFSSIFPTVPVMINWHSIGKICRIDKDWLISASLHHNNKLRFTNEEASLMAITRLDLSNNKLKKLPIIIFQLTSLKILNLSQNFLEILPEVDTNLYSKSSSSYSNKNKLPKSKSFTVNLSQNSRCLSWDLPNLEELYLQDNQLEHIPSIIFYLESLQVLDVSNNKLKNIPNNLWISQKLRDLNLSFNLIRDLPVSSQKLENQNFKNSNSISLGINKIQHSVSELIFQEDQLNFDSEANLKSQTINHVNKWNSKIDLINSVYIDDESDKLNQSKLVSLNLSHNSFSTIPTVLSCAAPNLTRLNMSFNCLDKMGCVKLYPSNIKHIDLSNNQIDEWFNVDFKNEINLNYKCYQHFDNSSKLSFSHCVHKEHSKLENLRTLLISKNKLTQLIVFSDLEIIKEEENTHLNLIDNKIKCNKLLFPNLSMLDISSNKLSYIPRHIFNLTNLSVLNISKNYEICQLPAEMGLLTKLWNLNTTYCNLDEPIKSIIECKKFKTVDIVGYLKSILEDSKLYTRIKLMIVGIQGIGKTTLLDLLRQEGTSSGFRKKNPEHWARRMGNKNINLRTPKGITLSTVGVDVCDFTYEKKIKNQQSFGPVTFRTWDFGGQKEYYATHQYFLSKRSLYLVVWRIIDGEKGVETIHKWLVNIQARAPNSPVIIIGTFFDEIDEYLPKNYNHDLQKMIRERFINIIDPDKVGLPRVVESIEVSTKTKYNIKNLCNLIYDTVFDIRCPGSKERLLMQKIPASYLALEDTICYLSNERKLAGKDPVLKSEEYKTLVLKEMHNRFGKTFREITELNQATSFLHENGVLLHYEDSTLKDLYFLDPQWLCDLLAHIVTIREINPYVKNGIMKTDDLKLLFKNISTDTCYIKSYILNLLNKFEVALTWDSRTVLIPSLLPTEEQVVNNFNNSDIRIPVRIRNWGTKRIFNNFSSNKRLPAAILNTKRRLDLINNDFEELIPQTLSFKITSINKPENAIYRIFLMTYFPCGFWSRLIVKLLADDVYSEIMKSYLNLDPELYNNHDFLNFLNKKSEWKCWQTGLSLMYLDKKIFHVKEVLSSVIIPNSDEFDYFQDVKFNLLQEKTWVNIEIQKSSILEVYFPNSSFLIQSLVGDNFEVIVEPNLEYITKLLSLTIDHIDILLEDWYPSLGTRFVHTSDGKFLVSRIVPCIKCLNANQNQDTISIKSNDSMNKSESKINVKPKTSINSYENSRLFNFDFKNVQERTLIYESKSRNNKSFDNISEFDKYKKSTKDNYFQNEDDAYSRYESEFMTMMKHSSNVVYCFMVEDFILKASEDKSIICPVHKKLNIKISAPDTAFCDLNNSFVFHPNSIKRAKLLGRGAFGFVFKATCKFQTKSNSVQSVDIALKTLQPVDPGIGAKNSDNVIYKAALGKWERDPLQYSCKAYCTIRQELNILTQLNHANIAPLLGVCLKPLALVLKLAPLGALDLILKDYRRSGMQLDFIVLQKTILQVAKALEYLHQNNIIYRDLKSENVLVWEIPLPHSNKSNQNYFKVDVKLADYGISRSTLPSGTKGFGGTEGFMAPEIMRYNGEEEYTEKVDCFSFGMFLFELITLRLPFEGQESIKDHILEGLRPKLTQRDILYPSYVLDLMTQCWSQSPNDRPSTSHIVSIISAPEFIHMMDSISLIENFAILCSDMFCRNDFYEIWAGRLGKQTDLLFCDSKKWKNYKTITNLANITVMSLCVIPDSGIWVGDSKTTVHIYSIDGSYIEITNFCLDLNSLTAVRTIKYISSLDIVVILSTSGRLWLCEKDTLIINEIKSFKLPYLCFALTEILDKSNFTCQIWCGQSEGEMTIINLNSFDNYNNSNLDHYSQSQNVPILDRHDVFEIISEANFVWTYLFPGSIVYQWSIVTKSMMQKLDCSKLAPCSESLMSISIEQHLNPSKCQIKSMAIMNDELYIGTTLGSLIIVEGSKMRPITVFRPFEEEIRLILPLNQDKMVHFSNNLNNYKTLDNSNFYSRNKNCVVTIGKGYRNLLDRYLNPLHDSSSNLITHSGLFAILWKPGNWTT